MGFTAHFWRGIRTGIPFFLLVAPFGMLFGVVATEAGLNLVEAMGFSVVVVAGAAQFTAIQLLSDQAPVWVAVISGLAINLRMVMYSASITPHLGGLSLGRRILAAYFLVDQTYACSLLDCEEKPHLTLDEKWGFFLGITTFLIPIWYGSTFAGAWVGNAVPIGIGLDFVVPIAFLSMVAPGLRTGAHRAAATVSVILALCLVWMPFNLGLLVAGLGGMMAGAEVERRSLS